jgi:hypothetical protein
MINGAHAILHSHDADATRATLAKVLGTRTVDAGGGWLIFALPPAELAVHPATDGGRADLNATPPGDKPRQACSSSLNQGRRAPDHAKEDGPAD